MIEKKLDIWKVYEDGEIVCITTNGFVKGNGRAVMGRGVAKQACEHCPGIDVALAETIGMFGNVVREIYPGILAFPVKPARGVVRADKRNVIQRVRDVYFPGQVAPGWVMKADTEIITRSLYELALLQDFNGWSKVYLPRPGCGAGELDWETEVKPLCERYGDWLVVVHI